MERLFFIISCCIFYNTMIWSQTPQSPHGTLIGAVICYNGILLSTDSRGSFTATDALTLKETQYAYVDSLQKIFKIGSYHMAISGSTNVGNTYWSSLIAQFNASIKAGLTVEQTFDQFIRFLLEKKQIPDSVFTSSYFITVGYEGNLPVIIGTNGHPKSRTSTPTDRIFSMPCIKNELQRLSAEAFKTEIVFLSLRTGYSSCSLGDKTIGGPVEILQITNGNKVKKLQNYKFRSFINYEQFKKAISKKQIKVEYTIPDAHLLLQRFVISQPAMPDY